jgi:hypothetical protein
VGSVPRLTRERDYRTGKDIEYEEQHAQLNLVRFRQVIDRVLHGVERSMHLPEGSASRVSKIEPAVAIER